jgi:DnaJ-domain-containing protein 1
MDESNTNQVRDSLKQWITFDDEERQLRQQIKAIKERKDALSRNILEFMRTNQVDNFSLEGNGVGNISRSVRTSRPPLRRNVLRTQLLLHFADQPQKVGEFLRSIEGIPEGGDNMSAGGTQRELLIRRVPRTTMSFTTTE